MNFDIQPTQLQNQLIKLAPLKETDFDELFLVAKDKLLWEQHPNKLRYQKLVFQNFFDGAIQSKGAFFIREATTNEPMGSSRFYDYNSSSNSILIGYTFIARKFWGKGYNKALKKLMIEYAFKFVDIIYFHIGATNLRSQKAMEKIGGIKIDQFEVTYFGEESKMNYIYVILKKDYKFL